MCPRGSPDGITGKMDVHHGVQGRDGRVDPVVGEERWRGLSRPGSDGNGSPSVGAASRDRCWEAAGAGDGGARGAGPAASGSAGAARRTRDPKKAAASFAKETTR